MTSTVESILLGGSLLLFLSVIASKISTKLGVPTLLIFIAVGMLVSVDGLGSVHFKNPQATQVLGIITLSFILFSGGLETEFKHIRPILWNGVLLSTVGVVITAGVVGGFITLVFNLSLKEGLLIGSIVSSTDASAVFSILRSRDIHLKANLSPTLELESGSNDAMALLLTIFFTALLGNHAHMNTWFIIPFFFQEMLLGALAGLIAGKSTLFIINRIRLAYEALYPALVFSIILFTYSFAHLFRGNGFLAVYIMGLILGNQEFIHKKSLIKFYDGIGWLLQIVMFIALGLLVSPAKLVAVAGMGVLISLVLMFIARPASVFGALFFSKADRAQKLFISWVGLRGAVPIVLATYPLIAGIARADLIFHIVFFVVLISMLFQGTSLHWAARRLNLLATPPKKQKPRALVLSEEVKSELIELVIPPDSPAIDKQVVNLGLPPNALIVLIYREQRYVTPRGDTVLQAGDKLMIMAEDKQEAHAVKVCLGVALPIPPGERVKDPLP